MALVERGMCCIISCFMGLYVVFLRSIVSVNRRELGRNRYVVMLFRKIISRITDSLCLCLYVQ